VKRTNIYLDEEQALLLRHLAIDEGRSFTNLVREAFNAYLAGRGLTTSSQVIGPRRSIPPDEWRSRLSDVLERIRTDPQDRLHTNVWVSAHARTLPRDPGAGREGRAGPRLRSGPSRMVGVALCPIDSLARPGAGLGRGEGGGVPRDVRVNLVRPPPQRPRPRWARAARRPSS